MSKTFSEIVDQYTSPEPEFNITIGGTDFSGNIDYFEFEFSINSPVTLNMKASGIEATNIKVVQNQEIVIKKQGFEFFRGIIDKAENKTGGNAMINATGFSGALEAKKEKTFKPEDNATVKGIINFLVDGYTVETANGSKTFSTSFNFITTINVEEFRVKTKQLNDLNRLMNEYGLEWYITFDANNEPVLNVTDQIINTTDSGDPVGTFRTSDPGQNAREISQTTNKNEGDFEGLVIRGYGDGDDQITASAKRSEVVASDKSNDTFTVKGDLRGVLSSGDLIRISRKQGLLGGGGSPDEGKFTVSSTSFDSNNNKTTVSVNEDVTDDTGGLLGGGDAGTMVHIVNTIGDARTKIITDKTVLSQKEAERKAINLLAERSIAWREIKVKPADSRQLFGIGSVYKVEEDEAKADAKYRIVEGYYKIRFDQNESESEIRLSNKPASFYDDFSNLSNTTESETDYMQGSRNVWGEKEVSNATTAAPFTLDFYVPEDVVDLAGKNRLKRVDLNFSSKPFKSGAESDTIQATNFDPSTKVVSTDVPNKGVKVEQSNISDHSHAVGSATSRGGSDQHRNNDISFTDESISEQSWEKIGSILNAPNPEKDLAHSFQFEITKLNNAGGPVISRDLFVAYVAKDFVANFTVDPATPFAGEITTLTDNSNTDGISDWTFGDGGSIDGSTRADDGEQVQHTFNEDSILSSDTSANEIVIATNYSGVIDSGNTLYVPEVDVSYIVNSVTTSGGDTVVTVSNLEQDVSGNTAQFEGNVFVTMELRNSSDTLLDSVTKVINVAPPIDASTLHKQNLKKPTREVKTDDVSTQATTIGPGDPNANATFTLSEGGSTSINFNGTLNSDQSGDLELFFIIEPRFNDNSEIIENTAVDSQPFSDPNFFSYSLDFTLNDVDDSSAIGGPGTYDYQLEYPGEKRRVGPIFVCYEGVTLNEPSGNFTTNDTSVLIDFEYHAGESLTDFELLLDGNPITSDPRVEYFNENITVPTSGSSINLDDSNPQTWDYGVGSASVEFIGANELNGDIIGNLFLNGDPITVRQDDILDLNDGHNAYVSKITFDKNFNNDVEGLFLSLYEQRKALITGLSPGQHTLKIRAEYNDDNDFDNTSVVEESVQVTVDQNDAPSSDFSISPLEPNVGQSIDFIDQSTDPEGNNSIIAWEWDFADGTTELIKDAAVTVEFNNNTIQVEDGENIKGSGFSAYRLEEILLNSHEIEVSAFVNQRTKTPTGTTDTVTVNGNELTIGATFVTTGGSLEGEGEATITVDGVTDKAKIGDQKGPNNNLFVIDITSTGPDGEGSVTFAINDREFKTIAFGESALGIKYLEDNPQPNGLNGDTTHTYTSENIYEPTLQVYDDNGLSNISTEIVAFGVDGRTVMMESAKNVGNDYGLSTSNLSGTTSGRTVKMDSFPGAGTQIAPTGDFIYRNQTYIPYQDIASNYEIYLALASEDGLSADAVSGNVKIKQINHTHDIPRRGDFNDSTPELGAGAEQKKIQFSKAKSDEDALLLDFSNSNERIVLDTTINSSEANVKIANEDSNGNLTNAENLSAVDGTDVSNNTFADEELYVEILPSTDKQEFELRSLNGDVAYPLVLEPTKSFSSSSEVQKTEDVSSGDGTEQNVAVDVKTGLLEGSKAEHYRIFIDDDPDTVFEINSISGSTITVNQDVSSVFSSGDDLAIEDSSANGQFTVSGVSGSDITVNESVDSSASDGVVNKNNEITEEFYGTDSTGDGNIDSDGPKDNELDISPFVDDPGWYRLKLVPDKPTFTKARVYLDHHKDTK